MDEKTVAPKVTVPADVRSVELGAEVWSRPDNKTYVIGSRKLCVDEQGQLLFEFTLHPAKPPWIQWLDRLSSKYPVIPQLISLLILAIIAVPVMFVFKLFLNDHDVPLALAGGAIVCAPWVIPFVCMLPVFFRAWPARRRIGPAIVYIVSFIALAAGGGLGLLWHALFVRDAQRAWPAGYVSLANEFSQNATSLVAVVAVYAPAILIVLKVLKLDSLGEIAGGLFRKPGGA